MMFDSCSSGEMQLEKKLTKSEQRYGVYNLFAFDAMEKCAKTSNNNNDTGRDLATGF